MYPPKYRPVKAYGLGAVPFTESNDSSFTAPGSINKVLMLDGSIIPIGEFLSRDDVSPGLKTAQRAAEIQARIAAGIWGFIAQQLNDGLGLQYNASRQVMSTPGIHVVGGTGQDDGSVKPFDYTVGAPGAPTNGAPTAQSAPPPGAGTSSAPAPGPQSTPALAPGTQPVLLPSDGGDATAGQGPPGSYGLDEEGNPVEQGGGGALSFASLSSLPWWAWAIAAGATVMVLKRKR